jgi:hypothetical protein
MSSTAVTDYVPLVCGIFDVIAMAGARRVCPHRPAGRPIVRCMGRHRVTAAPPPPQGPPGDGDVPEPALPTDWGGYASPDTDVEGWLGVLHPDDPPMMDI